jgi:hypothetical protein
MVVGERTIVNCKCNIYIYKSPHHQLTQTIVILATGVICLFTSIVGYVGIMLNNRAILTIYNLLLWPSFGMIAAIGYTAYRRNKWNLEGKLSYQWHYDLDADGRARVQANVSLFFFFFLYPIYLYQNSFLLCIASLLWL